MRTAWRLLTFALLALLLAGCPISNGVDVPTRIALLEAVPASVERGDDVSVTIRWRAEGAGSRPGLPSCSVSRQVEGDSPQVPFVVACSSSLTEVVPAGTTATYVRYELSVLKAPYDPNDPYLTAHVTVTVTNQAVSDEPVATGRFGDAIVVASATGPRRRYNREFVAIDAERVFYSRTFGIDGTQLEGLVTVHERAGPGSWQVSTSLTPPAGETYRAFGSAVEARGSTAVVHGHRLVSTDPDVYESVLNVFESNSSGGWSRTAVLLEGETFGPWFGTESVTMALSADTIAVGLARGWNGTAPSEVRIYGRNVGGANAWGVAATIATPASLGALAADYFGTDVDLSTDGRLLAVAASDQASDSCIGESLFVYERAATDSVDWVLVDTIDGSQLIGCSTYVAIDGAVLAVTAIGASWIDMRVFERGAGGASGWSEVRSHRFTVPTYADVGAFWTSPSIRLRDDTIALGMAAVQCISQIPTQPCAPGVVHVLRRDAGGVGMWGVDQELYSMPAYANQGFGVALELSVDGRHLVVGTNPRPTDDPDLGGEVFVFERLVN